MEPKDSPYDPYGRGKNPEQRDPFEDYDTWNRFEEDILDQLPLQEESQREREELQPSRNVRPNRRKGPRIIIENAFPTVPQEKNDREVEKEEERQQSGLENPSRESDREEEKNAENQERNSGRFWGKIDEILPRKTGEDSKPKEIGNRKSRKKSRETAGSSFSRERPKDEKYGPKSGFIENFEVLEESEFFAESREGTTDSPREEANVPGEIVIEIGKKGEKPPPRKNAKESPSTESKTEKNREMLRMIREGESPLLEVRDLSVEFSGGPVLREISFRIARGETVAIIGESGCGKTVLLKTLIGLLAPTSGTVWFDSMDINELPEKELTRQRTRFGFVFQQAALFDSMSIGENIAFPLRQHTRRSEVEILELVVRLLEEVGLSGAVIEKKPAELSGGMRKRVGFARALAMGPEIMLYDEPTTGLDPIMSDVINELILRTRENHDIGGIMVTHDMNSAKKVADRIIMLYPISRLKPGASQMIFDGTPEEIEHCKDRRVSQFLRGEAGERLFENL